MFLLPFIGILPRRQKLRGKTVLGLRREGAGQALNHSARAGRERICVLAKADFRRNTLCISRKADAAMAQIVREPPMAGGSVFA